MLGLDGLDGPSPSTSERDPGGEFGGFGGFPGADGSVEISTGSVWVGTDGEANSRDQNVVSPREAPHARALRGAQRIAIPLHTPALAVGSPRPFTDDSQAAHDGVEMTRPPLGVRDRPNYPQDELVPPPGAE